MQINDTQFVKLANSVQYLIDFPLDNPIDGYEKMTKAEKLDFLVECLSSRVEHEFQICPDCLEVMDEEVHLGYK